MNKKAGGNRGRRWFLAVLLAAALVATFAAAYQWTGVWLARRWQSQLSILDDKNVAGQLRRIAALGEPGFAVLADELDSPRESVADGARRVLFAQLTEWEALSAEDVTPRLLALSRALAGEIDNLDEQGRLVAGDVALRIVLWPPDQLTRERDGLIEPCRRVLDGRPKGRTQPTAVARADGKSPGPNALQSTGDDAKRRASDKTTIRLPPQSLEDVPGGALPVNTSDDSASAALSDRDSESSGNLDNEEPDVRNDRTPTAAGPGGMPVRLGARSKDARPLSGPGNSAANNGPPVDSALPTETANSIHDDVAGQAKPRFEQVEGTNAGELMQLLHGSDVATASWARNELSRRGFNKTELRLAERLADPDPRVRRQWVRYIPGLRGVDAQQWLLWLSRDDDADVRLTAITLMASTTNRELLDRLAELAASDNDARIRGQAERILQAAHGNQGRRQ